MFKLKAPKLDRKGKTIKLQRIVLACAPLVKVDQQMLDTFDLMRRAVRGEISEAEAMEVDSSFGRGAPLPPPPPLMWEPFSNLDEPPAKSFAEMERVIDWLGADVQRDRIMNCSFGEGRGYSMHWTWINQFPLLETQMQKAKPYAMRLVPEGTPCPPGYERIERIPADPALRT